MYENVRAAAVADSLIALYPKEAEAYLVRGQLYTQEKNVEAAVEMYERAVAADTGFALGVMSLGYAYSDLGDQDKAVSYMQRYIRMAPGCGRSACQLCGHPRARRAVSTMRSSSTAHR